MSMKSCRNTKACWKTISISSVFLSSDLSLFIVSDSVAFTSRHFQFHQKTFLQEWITKHGLNWWTGRKSGSAQTGPSSLVGLRPRRGQLDFWWRLNPPRPNAFISISQYLRNKNEAFISKNVADKILEGLTDVWLDYQQWIKIWLPNVSAREEQP